MTEPRWLDAIVRRNYAAYRRLLGEAERLAEQPDEAEAAAEALERAAYWAWFRSCGTFACAEAEALAARLAAAVPRRPAAARPLGGRHVVTVLTAAFAAGGHSRLAWRWMDLDTASAHTVVLTDQRDYAVPERLSQGADGRTRRVVRLQGASRLERAAELRALCASADFVVLHMHPNDVVVPMALAGLENPPPVLYDDHATHAFWLGLGISNVVVSLLEMAAKVAVTRRGVPRAQLSPLPIPLDFARLATPAERSPRLPLGIPTTAPVLLSSGSPFKFRPIGGISLGSLVLPVLTARPDAHLVVVGPVDEPHWQPLHSACPGRVHLLSYRPEAELVAWYQTAAVYLEPVPFSSGTALLEAAASGLPVVKFAFDEWRQSTLALDQDALPAPLYVWSDPAAWQSDVLGLLADESRRRARGTAMQAAVASWHGNAAVAAAIERAYTLAQQRPRVPLDVAMQQCSAFRIEPIDRQLVQVNANSDNESKVEALTGVNRPTPPDPQPKVIAYYLTQFHRIPENDRWWGTGFTEWTNVAKAVPLFDGHDQPQLPGEVGFYDLRQLDIWQDQVALAKAHGVHGFCFYYYWFGGRRLLEKPLDLFVEHVELDQPFCLCWANENWTRRWDGGNTEILMEQTYSDAQAEAFIADLMPYFTDPRYIRVDGRPMFLVYRTELLDDVARSAELWRAAAIKFGLPGLHLVRVESFRVEHPDLIGFDAACEFPPHQLGDRRIECNQRLVDLHGPANIQLFSYEIAAKLFAEREQSDYLRYRGVMTAWDNSARRGTRGSAVYRGSTPELYGRWLGSTLQRAVTELPPGERFVFINAWNEWAEGAHLEPDRRHGRAYLEATRAAVAGIAAAADRQGGRWHGYFDDWLAAQQQRITAALAAGVVQAPVRLSVIMVGAASALSVMPADVQLLGCAESWPAVASLAAGVQGSQDWLIVLGPGDQLAPTAAACLAARCARSPEAVAVYCDEDRLTADGRHEGPALKPDFDPDFLYGFDYLGGAVFLKGEALAEVGGLDAAAEPVVLADAVLRLAERHGDTAVAHLAEVLVHRSAASLAYAIPLEQVAARHAAVVTRHLERRQLSARLAGGLLPGTCRVLHPVPENLRVGIVWLIADDEAALLVKLQALLEKTQRRVAVAAVAGPSVGATAKAALDQVAGLRIPELKVIHGRGSLPQLANAGAEALTEADVLVFLDSRQQVVQAQWLEPLLGHVLRPGIGMVGCRVLSEGGRIVQADLVPGLDGGIGEAFVGAPADAPGYLGLLANDHTVPAIHAWPSAIQRSVFLKLGGWTSKIGNDPAELGAELAVRLGAERLRVLWTPYAVTVGPAKAPERELGSREGHVLPDALKDPFEFAHQWNDRLLAHSPAALRSGGAYNPNLALCRDAYTLEHLPELAGDPALRPPLPAVAAIPIDRGGCGHYRVIAPAKALQAAGLARTLAEPLPLNPAEVGKFGADVFVVQIRRIAEVAAYRNCSGAELVFEVDDLLWQIPDWSPSRKYFPADVYQQLRDYLPAFDRIVVSTEPLAEAMRKLHRQVVVAANALPPEPWAGLQCGRRPGKPRVGWAGGNGHSADLAILEEVIPELADEVEWVFLGDMPSGPARRQVAERHFHAAIEDYPARLAALDLDVALAPLCDHPFNHCKSNLRVLEWGALGVPVVASDLTPYRGLPTFLVPDRPADWVRQIRELISDREAARAAGAALREHVHAHWMLRGARLDAFVRAWLG